VLGAVGEDLAELAADGDPGGTQKVDSTRHDASFLLMTRVRGNPYALQ
jgi:hypothetical protein